MNVFEIDKAINFIRQDLDEPVKSEISDDDLEVIVEMILDYFEDNGFLEIDCEKDDPEPSEVSEYIGNKIKSVEPDYPFLSSIQKIVEAEYKYEEMLIK